MPQRPPRVCSYVGCYEITTNPTGRCDIHPPVFGSFSHLHTKEARKRDNKRRPESDKFYKTRQWQRLRAAILARNPLCQECASKGRINPAKIVDHIVPFRLRPDLGMERSNLRPLCAACHNRIGEKIKWNG